MVKPSCVNSAWPVEKRDLVLCTLYFVLSTQYFVLCTLKLLVLSLSSYQYSRSQVRNSQQCIVLAYFQSVDRLPPILDTRAPMGAHLLQVSAAALTCNHRGAHLHFVLCTLYFVLCTLYFVLCTLYSVLCTLQLVLSTQYFVLCTQYLDQTLATVNLYRYWVLTLQSYLGAIENITH